MPGKAVCRETHEEQRYLLKLKARQEQVKPVFKVGAREIGQAAQAMHCKFVSLNTEKYSPCRGQSLWLVALSARQRCSHAADQPPRLGQAIH
jgi:hypothetical protein